MSLNQLTKPEVELTGTTAIVTGASRGFGRAIAAALSAAGADVVGVARSGAQLDQVRDELGDTFTPVTADATDPTAAGLSVVSVLPRLTPVADTGTTAIPTHHRRPVGTGLK
jgi:NADP-dependent 3-hydroxy acid dehydrogenase YdfG